MLFKSRIGTFSSPTGTLLISPCLGKSGLAISRTLCALFSCNSNSEPRAPMVNGQRRGFPYRDIATRDVNSLTFQTPSPEVPISRLNATWTPLVPGVPRCHVTFGISRIAESTMPSFPVVENPERRTPILWDLLPPVPALIDGSRITREIATRDFNE
jgi:hypothetical protein